jgi:hypothetical protein
VSDVPQGPGWWRASNGLYYPPEARPGSQRPGPQADPDAPNAPDEPDEVATSSDSAEHGADDIGPEPEPTQAVPVVPGDETVVTESWNDEADDETRRSTPRWLIPAALAGLVFLVAAIAAVWFLVLDDGDADTEASTDTTEVPDTTADDDETVPTTEDTGEVWVFDIEVGDCFDTSDIESGDGLVATTVRLVDCDEPHFAEVFSIEELDTPSGEPFPGVEARNEASQALCEAGFEAFVGVPVAASDLVLLWLAPTAESWDDDDRAVTCAVASDDPDEPLVGSVEGSER